MWLSRNRTSTGSVRMPVAKSPKFAGAGKVRMPVAESLTAASFGIVRIPVAKSPQTMG
jgi:hypothetical protein